MGHPRSCAPECKLRARPSLLLLSRSSISSSLDGGGGDQPVGSRKQLDRLLPKSDGARIGNIHLISIRPAYGGILWGQPQNHTYVSGTKLANPQAAQQAPVGVSVKARKPNIWPNIMSSLGLMRLLIQQPKPLSLGPLQQPDSLFSSSFTFPSTVFIYC